MRAAISAPRGLGLEPLQRFGPAEHHELVAGADRRVRLGVELHAAVLPLNADDDHAEPLAQVRVENRSVRPAPTPRAIVISSIASSRLSELVASSMKSTTAGRSAVCAICTRADLVRRDDAVGAGALQLQRRILGFGAADDEQIGPQHARAQHGVDVLGVGADGRDQPARALDADALQHVLAAGVGLHAERAVLDRRLHALGSRSMTTYGIALPPELPGDDAADAAVAADDEVILDRFEHTFVPAPLQALGQPALDDDRREQGEGVERRADAAEQQHDGEHLAGARQVVDLPVADRRDA